MTVYPSNLNAAADYLRRLESAIDSVRFCRQVRTDFVTNGREPTEMMDAKKADQQFRDAVDRLLEEASKR